MSFGLIKRDFFDNDLFKELKLFEESGLKMFEDITSGGFIARGDGKGYICVREIKNDKNFKCDTKCTYEEIDGMEAVRVETKYQNTKHTEFGNTEFGYESFLVNLPKDADSDTIQVDSFPDGMLEIRVEKKCTKNE